MALGLTVDWLCSIDLRGVVSLVLVQCIVLYGFLGLDVYN